MTEPNHEKCLTKLREIKSELDQLRENRTVYIRSEDVFRLYQSLHEQIRACDHFDKDQDEDEEGKSQVYEVTKDCLLLISLFFMTIGRNSEAPAVYAPCIVLKRLIQHLNESGNFSNKDVESIEKVLADLESHLEAGSPKHPREITRILEPEILDCRENLIPLQQKLKEISPELAPLHEKLVSIRRSIKGCEAKGTFSLSEVNSYQDELTVIESKRVDGKFLGSDGSELAGQEIVEDLLQKCHAFAEEASKRQGHIAPTLRPTADKLFRLRSHLERLSVTQAWSLRETDLYDFMKEVQAIDASRVNGKFVDEEGKAPDDGQSILLYLVRRCYMYIFTLIVSSEPVSEALTPIYNQLQTVRRCLLEVQKTGGISSTREFYPYSMKLASIENHRVDGKFMVGSDIPEGQGRVNSLLAECFEILHELRSSNEE